MTQPTNQVDGTIRFYHAFGEHGFLSNFARFPIELDGRVWPSVEHFYQAHKFDDPALQESIRATLTPRKAAKLGRSHPDRVRSDWSLVKDSVMERAVRAKFAQHPSLAALLLATGDVRLVEHTPLDRYWADGGDGSGLNRLGLLLENVRESLRRPNG